MWVKVIVFALLGLSLSYAQQDKDREIRLLKKQLQASKTQQLATNTALVASKKAEQEANEKLKELTLRLQALGMHQGGAEERLVLAVADAQALSKRLTAIQEVVEEAQNVFKDFAKHAIVEDADKRLKVAVAMKKLDAVIYGLRDTTKVEEKSGSLQDAKVLSIDAKSGTIVLNVGSQRDAKVGMTFVIKRGEREIGEVMIAEVRQKISGALITSLKNTNEDVQFGDKAHVKLQRGR